MEKINKKIFVIDAHEDIALNSLYVTHKDIGKRYSLHQGYNDFGFTVNNNVDLPRLRKGKVKFVFATIFSLSKKTVKKLIQDKKSGYNFKKLVHFKTDLAGALEQLSYYYQVERKYRNFLKIITSKKDYQEVKKDKKRLALFCILKGLIILKI